MSDIDYSNIITSDFNQFLPNNSVASVMLNIMSIYSKVIIVCEGILLLLHPVNLLEENIYRYLLGDPMIMNT